MTLGTQKLIPFKTKIVLLMSFSVNLTKVMYDSMLWIEKVVGLKRKSSQGHMVALQMNTDSTPAWNKVDTFD